VLKAYRDLEGGLADHHDELRLLGAQEGPVMLTVRPASFL
jgi:hypothetical protein